jgi:hypothetical protein
LKKPFSSMTPAAPEILLLLGNWLKGPGNMEHPATNMNDSGDSSSDLSLFVANIRDGCLASPCLCLPLFEHKNQWGKRVT